jgi:GNAT superfamily N-acetyltransferase
MIREITENDIPYLLSVSRKNVFLGRILSGYTAYGHTKLGQFWVQTEEDRLNTVLGKVDDVVTIAYISDGNLDELAGFLYAIGSPTVVCSGDFANRHYLGKMKTGPILRFDNSKEISCSFVYEKNPSLREVYPVLEQCRTPQFPVPKWEPFYLDMNHRIRHGCGLCVGIRGEEDTLVGCGFTVAQTEHTAILGGVCVLPKERHQGYGKQVVTALLSSLTQPEVYVFREEQENRDFYESLGFVEWGRWAEIRR